MTPKQDKNIISQLIAEKGIFYRPSLKDFTGSVTGAIFLQQISYWWYVSGGKPFYKFIQPCQNDLYKEGDSWCEELNFSYYEIQVALDKFATKITKGTNKSDAIEKSAVIYWTDSNRVTWWQFNPDTFERLFSEQFVNPLGNSEIPNLKNSNYLENESSTDTLVSEGTSITFNTESTTEINTDNSAQAEQLNIKVKPKTVINRKDLSIEGQMYMSDEPVIKPTEQDERNRRMRDFASYVGFQNSSAGSLAMAFMEARGIIFDIKADGKKERKFAADLLQKGVKPEHITIAVRKMTTDRIAEGKEPLTCVSLGSVSKIAIDLATQLPEVEIDNTPANGWGEFED